MTNEAFDETTEHHYSPGLGLWMDEWENNPLVWQHPMAETPYGWTLLQEYDRLYRQTETKTLVDVVMERPRFQQATSQFRMYLEAMIVAQQAQLHQDRLPVVEDQQLRQLPMTQQLQVARKLEQQTEMVFQWMVDQGMEPIQSTTVWPGLVSQTMVDYVADND